MARSRLTQDDPCPKRELQLTTVEENTKKPRTKKCSICRKPGHNRRTCPDRDQEKVPKARKWKCSICREPGHNKRTCPDRQDQDEEYVPNTTTRHSLPKARDEHETRSKQRERSENISTPPQASGQVPINYFDRAPMVLNCGAGKMRLTANSLSELIISRTPDHIALLELPSRKFLDNLLALLNKDGTIKYCADFDKWKSDKFAFLWRSDVCTLKQGMKPILSDENKYCVYFCEDIDFGTIAFFVVHLRYKVEKPKRVSALVAGLDRVVRSHPSLADRICVLGDFNVQSSNYRKELKRYSMRPLLDEGVKTTPLGSCIDNVLVPDSWELLEAEVDTEFTESDHFPVFTRPFPLAA